MTRVLTVILNWRTPEMTMQSVTAALREMNGIAGDITVVDNASGDGSFEKMTAHVAAQGWTRVRVVQAGHNGGFGAGNNFGIRAGLHSGARPDYVYVLNSDAFPDPGAIRALFDHLEAHPKAGFAGSYIHGPDGDVHLTTFRFPSIAGEFEGAVRSGPVTRLFKNSVVSLPTPARTQAVDWLAGCSLLMRMATLDRIGLFDETFFLYFEETDLCRRAAQAGIETHFVRQSEVTHIGGETTGSKRWTRTPGYWFDSRLHYFVKNHGPVYAACATLAHLTGGILHRLRCLLAGKPFGEPDHFLRDLVAHDLRALLRPTIRPVQVHPQTEDA